MKRLLYLAGLTLPALALVCLPSTSVQGDEKKGTYPAFGTIERKDPRLDKLIAPSVKSMQNLAEGFDWAEGPVWVNKDGGYLLCSDIPKNQVVKWQSGKGKSVYLQPSGYFGKATDLKEPGSNGLLLDKQGRLVLMMHGERCVGRQEADGKIKKLVERYMGKRFNSPNDGVFHSNGDLYFTDPPYGLGRKDKEGFPGQELDFCGIYRLTPKGELTLLNKDMTKPNGIAFSPDEKTLYVSNSDPDKAVWMKFPVKADGTLGEGKVFFDSTTMARKLMGLPDGMKIDKDGNVWATGPGGLLIFTRDGTHLGTLLTGVRTANCGWGGDGSVLYICADKNLLRIQTLTKGKGF